VVMFSYVQGGVIAAGGPAYQRYLNDYEVMVKSTIRHPAVLAIASATRSLTMWPITHSSGRISGPWLIVLTVPRFR
jgi:hypothetical protein